MIFTDFRNHARIPSVFLRALSVSVVNKSIDYQYNNKIK